MSNDPLVTIGAHTLRHLALSKLSASEARAEILESRRQIELRTDKQVEPFAYPHGGRGTAGPREFQMIKDCGFKTATTTRNANIFAAHKDSPECLPRTDVPGADIGKNIESLNLRMDGLVSCHENSFVRLVTV